MSFKKDEVGKGKRDGKGKKTGIDDYVSNSLVKGVTDPIAPGPQGFTSFSNCRAACWFVRQVRHAVLREGMLTKHS